MTQNIKAVEKIEALTPEENNRRQHAPEENSVPIAKPGEFNLDKFKAKRAATVANVETLPSPLPVHNMAAAKDFVRLHPDEENYWSAELCFVDVPIKGQKHNTLHLIDEDLALQFLEAGEIKRFRLALASKPNDVFFLCEVPTQNLDNSWNTRIWRHVKRPRRFGRRRPAAKAKALRATKSRPPVTPTLSAIPTGRRSHSANSSRAPSPAA